jgi:hypothetical protein
MSKKIFRKNCHGKYRPKEYYFISNFHELCKNNFTHTFIPKLSTIFKINDQAFQYMTLFPIFFNKQYFVTLEKNKIFDFEEISCKINKSSCYSIRIRTFDNKLHDLNKKITRSIK